MADEPYGGAAPLGEVMLSYRRRDFVVVVAARRLVGGVCTCWTPDCDRQDWHPARSDRLARRTGELDSDDEMTRRWNDPGQEETPLIALDGFTAVHLPAWPATEPAMRIISKGHLGPVIIADEHAYMFVAPAGQDDLETARQNVAKASRPITILSGPNCATPAPPVGGAKWWWPPEEAPQDPTDWPLLSLVIYTVLAHWPAS